MDRVYTTELCDETTHVDKVFTNAPQHAIHVIAVAPLLQCMVPGDDAFVVKLADIASLGELRQRIKRTRPQRFESTPANAISIYVAKEQDKWLGVESDETAVLKRGKPQVG